MKFKQLSHSVIGCAMEVHNFLGNGFQELIYQRALAIELTNKGIVFGREVEAPIQYKGEQVGIRRMDFLIENILMLEIKAVSQIDNAHIAQSINYLEAYELEAGLLINFGAKSLEFRRVYSKRMSLEQDLED